MTEDETKVKTYRFKEGSWYGEVVMEEPDKEIKVHIDIGDMVKLTIDTSCKDDEGEIITQVEDVTPFSSNAHWMEQFLSFTDNQKFFIMYANETEMKFGRLESEGVFSGSAEWVIVFKRREE